MRIWIVMRVGPKGKLTVLDTFNSVQAAIGYLDGSDGNFRITSVGPDEVHAAVRTVFHMLNRL